MRNEQGWLIEWQKGKRAEWLGINDKESGVAMQVYFFTIEADEALRFGRKEDAEAFIKFVGIDYDVTVTGHTFYEGDVA